MNCNHPHDFTDAKSPLTANLLRMYRALPCDTRGYIRTLSDKQMRKHVIEVEYTILYGDRYPLWQVADEANE